MASIPQEVHIQNTYQYAAQMLRSGKRQAAIKQTLVADGLSESRADAILLNLQQAKRRSVRNYLRLHPILHRVETRLRGIMK